MEASDQKEEIKHVNQVLTHCGYQSLMFKQVHMRARLESKDTKIRNRKKEQCESLIKTMVTCPM